MKSQLVACFITLVLSVQLVSAQTVRINKVEGAKEELIFSLLQLALTKADPRARVEQMEEVVSVGRWAVMTEEGSLDLLWAGSSKEFDERMTAVRIPLLKGLLGHRIFIIRDGDQRLFDSIYNLEDLKALNAGMGTFWGSTKVLEDAGLPVIKTVKYPNLFYMLDGSRFDYFPRAVHEPWDEITNRPDLNLSVEDKLLLIYPYAMYFYVRKDNLALHNKLKRGLEIAIKDGSFDQVFFANSMIKNAMDQAGLGNRTVLRINNLDIHPDTPLDRPELWLDINKL